MGPKIFIYLIFYLPLLKLAAENAQKCPDFCTCSFEDQRVTVTCENVGLATISRNFAKIDELHLTHLNQTEIEEFSNFGGNLKVLKISNSSLEAIGTTAFKSLENSIEHIDLSGNRVKIAPNFGALKKLLSLNLNNNQISQIPEKSFAHLDALTQLRLESNKICEFPPKSLDSMKNSLVLLDISDNCLSAIPAQILRNSGSLTYLDLSSNNISEINNFELMNLGNLRELRLQNNTLRKLHPMAFMNVPQLEYLFLQDNIISSLDGNRLQAFKKLEILDIRNNALISLPSLKDLANLKQVKVDGNLIEKIETLAFSNNPKLQLISMQNNNIMQISRNSFDSLDNLIILLLANNSITKIERGMLDGIRNLQQLSLRNNTLKSIDNSSFPQLLHLTNLDLAWNLIEKIEPRSFDRLSKLFWLDLSNNRLSEFEENVFVKKISNILLDGNSLSCSSPNFPQFLTYLIKNKVRTFLPFQKEITCENQETREIHRLKDLMLEKSEELAKIPVAPTQNLLPPSSFFPMAPERRPGPPGAQNSGPNLDQIIRSMPSMMVNVPGFGDVDLSKMDPGIIKYVLNGGQIPGLDKSTLDGIVKQAMARATGQGSPILAQEEPQGASGFSPQIAPRPPNTHSLPNISKIPSPPEISSQFSPMMFSILKLLPKGYNLNKIPKEVIESIGRGEVPDLALLPQDLLEHFRASPRAMMTAVVDGVQLEQRNGGKNMSIEELLSKLPVFARPELSTFVPYDINSLTSEMVLEKQRDEQHKKIRIITAISLSFIAVITICVLAFFVNYTKKQRKFAKNPPVSSRNLANRPLPPAPIYHPRNF